MVYNKPLLGQLTTGIRGFTGIVLAMRWYALKWTPLK